MNSILLAFVIGIGLSILTVFGDSIIKNASLQPSLTGWKLLVFGAIIYGDTLSV